MKIQEDICYNESTILLPHSKRVQGDVSRVTSTSVNHKVSLFLWLEGKTAFGLLYEYFTILLIFTSVFTFIIGTLFDDKYNPGELSKRCGSWCDSFFFGNDPNNALKGLGIGATSVLEIFIVTIFTIDYFLRIYTADLLDEKFKGALGRLKFVVSFFSVVDLASIVPFYVDAFLLPNVDISSSNFVRMFRLLRMMKLEGRYELGFSLIGNVVHEQIGILGITIFVGGTVWFIVAAFFYLVERRNLRMIYCGAAPLTCFDTQDEINTSLCVIDEFGFVDCSLAGCPNFEGKESCWNLYRSIFSSCFWSLMNLFGEFPLIDQHSTAGMLVGTFTTILAVAVFAVPTSILASGIEEQISRRRKSRVNASNSMQNFEFFESSYDELKRDDRLGGIHHQPQNSKSRHYESFMNFLAIGVTATFVIGTFTEKNIISNMQSVLNSFQSFAVIVFTMDYIIRLHSDCDTYGGRVAYACRFQSIVDFLSFAPYLIAMVFAAVESNILVRWFLLLRLFKFERYTYAFSSFHDVIGGNSDVLIITGFTSILLWVFFSSIMYFSERDNQDFEMANYYKSVPHAMWITLLNLSGECPLSSYTVYGKVTIGIISLWGSSIFGITIGVIGSGFENFYTDSILGIITSDENDSTKHEYIAVKTESLNTSNAKFQRKLFDFVNGVGSKAAECFQRIITSCICATVIIGIIETIPIKSILFRYTEILAVVIFTVEYVLRMIAAGSDPQFDHIENGLNKRLRFFFSFYSFIDLAAIIPYYASHLYENSWLDNHDEYLRMLRLFRLLKLEQYTPSFTLLDDVFHLKRSAILMSCYAAGTLLILFSGLMYVAESSDVSNHVDNLPLYGCQENCTMSVRYSNFFNSLTLASIHLTGDYPIVDYSSCGRIICFFMIILAVGVVSIPSGLISSGFLEILQSKTKGTKDDSLDNGDDWFDVQYRNLENIPPPPSMFGLWFDRLQLSLIEYLDGSLSSDGRKINRTRCSYLGRLLFFVLIVANVIAVVAESVPEIDRYVGNSEGNAFDRFEMISVMLFTLDYLLRLISATKSRKALYSPWVYATTFFGLVDIISIAPWYIQQYLVSTGHSINGDEATIFRILRIFRILQIEDFVAAFSKLDNVFRASKNVIKATGLMALIIWILTSALFYIFEKNNPNFRSCDSLVPTITSDFSKSCYDFESTAACNDKYPGSCSQTAFTNMPNSMFYVAVFLGGEWGLVDFTVQGKILAIITCMMGIALYAIPVGTLFDSFGLVLGISSADDENDEDVEEERTKLDTLS